MGLVKELIRFLQEKEIIFIQTHNFPDHDAVASAFGLQKLLEHYKIAASIIYEGDIQRDSLRWMIEELDINIAPARTYPVKPADSIIIVDGCKGNKNVTDLLGEEVAVIDHHLTVSPEEVWYADIRPEYGACATIIQSYYEEMDLPPSREVATALMIGLLVDTTFLTRGVSPADAGAYYQLFAHADLPFANRVLRNNINWSDLDYYRHLIDHMEIDKNFAFCWFPQGCAQNLLGILANFALSLQEVEFAVLCAHNGNVINVSVRSEHPDWNAAQIVDEVLTGIGFGGGHYDMAGGIVTQISSFRPEDLQALFKEKLKIK